MRDDQAKQATPPAVLHARLMSRNVAKNELEHYAADLIRQQQEMIEKFRTIVSHATAERTGVYFICGEVGPKDGMGLPELIMVCPSFGLDGFAMYTKTADYSAPSY